MKKTSKQNSFKYKKILLWPTKKNGQLQKKYTLASCKKIYFGQLQIIIIIWPAVFFSNREKKNNDKNEIEKILGMQNKDKKKKRIHKSNKIK